MKQYGAKKLLLLFLSAACLWISLPGCEALSDAVSPQPYPQSEPPAPTHSPSPVPALSSEPAAEPSPIPSAVPSVVPSEEPEAVSGTVGLSGSEEALLSSMTVEEKVGQMFFTRCPKAGAAEMAEYQFGGYILFGRDFDGYTAEEIRDNIQSYQNAAKIPLLIGVDEEGGTVVRMSSNSNLCGEPFWSPRKLYNSGGMQSVLYAEGNKLLLFSDLGINVNFAPVCDISTDPDDFMYDRSLGEDPVTTGEYVRQVVELYRENGTGNVLKHFPGYGNNPDTHTGVAIDGRSYDSFCAADFIPFQAGIDAGAGCVLVSHNIVTCVDPDAPASLSKAWHDILRDELGYDGCIITDDLYMDAIQEYCGEGYAAVMAVTAGNDLLCCTNYQDQYPAVVEAVKSGEISEERIDESVRRILRWKRQLGLLDTAESQ